MYPCASEDWRAFLGFLGGLTCHSLISVTTELVLYCKKEFFKYAFKQWTETHNTSQDCGDNNIKLCTVRLLSSEGFSTHMLPRVCACTVCKWWCFLLVVLWVLDSLFLFSCSVNNFVTPYICLDLCVDCPRVSVCTYACICIHVFVCTQMLWILMSAHIPTGPGRFKYPPPALKIFLLKNMTVVLSFKFVRSCTYRKKIGKELFQIIGITHVILLWGWIWFYLALKHTFKVLRGSRRSGERWWKQERKRQT